MASLLATVCVLHVLTSAARAGILGPGTDLWRQNSGSNNGGCSGCRLDKMVKSCPLDVMFLLDMSESIPPISYEAARNYVAKQMKEVSDTFQDTHVGLLAFSEVVHHDIPIKARSPQQLQQLMTQVRNLPQERYGTEIAGTLRRARRALTNQTAGGLVPGAPRGKVVVLVSDGCEDNDRAVEREGVQAVLEGIYIISVTLSEAYLGILKKISQQILELRTDIDWRGTVACPTSFLPPVPMGSVCSNVVVAMDGSDSVRRWESVMRDYLAYTSMRYNYVDNAIGVVVFGTNVTTQSRDTMLPPTTDKEWLAAQIESTLAFPNRRGTGTTVAIQVATAFLTPLPPTSAQSPNTIVVITDGPALNPSNAREALARAAQQGFSVVVVGVGNVLSLSELQTLAGSGSTVLQVDSYLDLYALDLSEYLCRQGQSGGPCANMPACSVAGKVRNPLSNCQCQCPNTIQCSSGQTMNTDTCYCECRRTCNFGQTLNTASCTCERQLCTNTCPSGFQQNENTCQCECRRTCNTFGERLNTASCTCEQSCTKTCPAGFDLNQNTCQCECRRSCSYGQTLNTASCICERSCTKTCPSGFNLNQNSCQCECRRSCSYGQILNTAACTCERSCTKTCPSGFDLNQVACQCECRRSCSFGQTLNTASCRCERRCTNTCSTGFELNQNTCQCECRRSCSFGQTLNTASCTCERRCTNTCPAGLQLNQNTCQCECRRTCSFGQRLNSASCTCERVCTNTCAAGFDRDPNTCRCVCRRSCSFGQTLNTASCTCEKTCSNTCVGSFVQDPNTCRCECGLTQCPIGQQLERASCICKRQLCTNTCPSGFQQNLNTCQCACALQYCPQGQTLNQATCSCDPVGCTNTQNCPSGTRFNSVTCQCDRVGCTNTINCPSGTRLNSNTCRCDPVGCTNTINCPSGTRLNPSTCRCDSVGCANTLNCPSGSRFNSVTCQCESVGCSNTQNCPTGTTFNSVTCQCERSSCTQTSPCQTGFVFNTTVCQCVSNCRQTQQCRAGTYFDEDRCQCVSACNIQCPNPNTRLDQSSCTCVPRCNRQCNGQQTLDPASCTCRCTRGCRPNEQQNPDTCACTARDLCTKTCPAGFDLDRNLCQCVCARQSCPQGQTLNQVTCSCVPDQPVEQCTAAESRCENGQKAVRDCQGRCICHCDTNKFVGKYCQIPVESSLCDNCTFSNGHYLAAVEGQCDMYVVCQPLDAGGYQPRVSFCAPGTIFTRQGPLMQCSGLEQGGVCPVDPCRTLPPGARYGHASHCAKYWQCRDGRTASEGCCPQGQGFDSSTGQCVPDSNCPNNCAPGFVSCSGTGGGRGGGVGPISSCPYVADPENRKQFYHREAPEKKLPCAPTDFFNETACLCTPDLNQGCVPYYDISFDDGNPNNSVSLRSEIPGSNGNVGYFNGNARIILLRFSGSGFYFPYLEVALRVRLDDNVNFGNSGEMAIVSNGDCGQKESLAITVDAQNVYFKITPDGTTEAEVIAVPYSRTADGWLDLRFQYRKEAKMYQLKGTVNGQSKSKQVSGRIDDRTCALQIGHGLGYDNLKGSVDDFKVWICKP